MLKPFLTANWRYLAMLNYAVDPKLVAPLVPSGTELDFYKGETFLSVVGFLFLDTRLLGFPIPLHRDFEEVNLRFYIRRQSADTWRRGVAFVRELVPKRAIAVTARVFYGEPYSALPMRHEIVHRDGEIAVEYGWRRGRKWESIALSASGEPQGSKQDSLEEFITEHYWGYTKCGDRCSEYRVEHPRWKIWPATKWKFEADIDSLYGADFVETLTANPTSAFIAEGSHVQVFRRSEEG